MPSIWCPKCQFNKKRSPKCPQCGFIEEDNTKTYKVPKKIPNRVLTGKKQDTPKKYTNKTNFSIISKNPLLTGAIITIALSVGYLAFAKYQEHRKYDKWMEVMIGTSEPEKAPEVMRKQLEELNKQMDKALIDSYNKQKDLTQKILNGNEKK